MSTFLFIGKYPPIQGGVSRSMHRAASELAQRGHTVHVVTNASQSDPGFRDLLWGDDFARLEPGYGSGSVHLHNLGSLPTNSYVPWAQPFVSQLIGVALAACERSKCDMVFSGYLEPYCVAGAVVASVLGSPFVMQHAGSDLVRLASFPDLAPTYRWVVSRATRILTGRADSATRSVLASLGAKDDQLLRVVPSRLSPEFSDRGPALDLVMLGQICGAWFDALMLPKPVRDAVSAATASPAALKHPTVGIYGKVGRYKGTLELLCALDCLAKQGQQFHLLAAAGGTQRALERFYLELLSRPALARLSCVLPLVAPWRVPEFLRTCDIVCFLEHDFPVPFHAPQVPREVLAAGRCLVLSSEVARAQAFSDNLVSGRNVAICDDPRDITKLSALLGGLLCDGDRRHSIARHGWLLSRYFEQSLQRRGGVAAALEGLCKRPFTDP